MSWSFVEKGMPLDVAKAARAAASGTPYCKEPEEGIRKSALDLIANAAESYADGQRVSVQAYGSQYVENDKVLHNELKITLTPMKDD